MPPQPRVEQKDVALPDRVRVPVTQRDVEPVARLPQLLHGADVPGLPPGDLVVERPAVVPNVVRVLVPTVAVLEIPSHRYWEVNGVQSRDLNALSCFTF